MPFKIWAIGEEVLAQDFNDYLGEQVIATFANAAARDAAIVAPNVGQVVHVAAVGLQLFDGVGWVTIRGGQTVQTPIPTNPLVTVGPTIETTLATLNIPARPYPYTLELSQQVNAYASVSGDSAFMRLKVNGTQVALLETRFSGVNTRTNLGQATSKLTQIAANAAAVATLTVQGAAGATGNFGFGPPQDSYLTARISF